MPCPLELRYQPCVMRQRQERSAGQRKADFEILSVDSRSEWRCLHVVKHTNDRGICGQKFGISAWVVDREFHMLVVFGELKGGAYKRAVNVHGMVIAHIFVCAGHFIEANSSVFS